MKNIVLIGFMGTGKTTAGHLLANRFGWSFIDIDQKVEETCNMSVAHIFAQYGEKYFREQEKVAIKNLLGCSHTVIATGGGVVLSDENIKNLKKCGTVVCLHAKPETIIQRLKDDHGSRPLLTCAEKLDHVSKLMQERRERYQSADLSLDTDEFNPWEVTENIIRFFGGISGQGTCGDRVSNYS